MIGTHRSNCCRSRSGKPAVLVLCQIIICRGTRVRQAAVALRLAKIGVENPRVLGRQPQQDHGCLVWNGPVQMASLMSPEMFVAVQRDRTDAVERLLTEGVEIDAVSSDGETALQVALANGACRAALVLIRHGAALDVEGHSRRMPMHMAAIGGHVEVVDAMLAQGSMVDEKDTYGCTPLLLAVKYGHVRLVEFLLARGAFVKAQCLDYEESRFRGNWTPLHEAARNGQIDIVRILVTHGADVRARDRYLPRDEKDPWEGGRTPLHYGAKEGKVDIINVLLAHGATIDDPDEVGFTPLHAAATADRVDAARTLLARGASVWTRDFLYGQSIYDWAAEVVRPGSGDRRHAVAEVILTGADKHTMTSPRYEDLEDAQREWSTGTPGSAVDRVARVIRRSNDEDRRLRAIDLLGKLGAAARLDQHDFPWVADSDAERHALLKAAVPVLIETLVDPDERVRLRACSALGEIGALATDAIPHLRRLAEDASQPVKMRVNRTIGKILPHYSTPGVSGDGCGGARP